MFIKESPIISTKTCCIYGFLLDVEAIWESKRWYDFIVECKYLFMKNIYSYDEI